MKVVNDRGTILESNNEFVIASWKAAGFKEIPPEEPKKKPGRKPKE